MAEDWPDIDTDDKGIRARIVLANLAGAALAALEIVVVGLPEAGRESEVAHGNLVSGLVLFAYLLAVVPVELTIASRRVRRAFGWVDEHRHPTQQELPLVFAFAWVQARRVLVYWIGAAVLFATLNALFDNNLAYCLRIGLHILLGGLTASALSFLVLERFNRPVFALALSLDPTGTIGRLGLRRRLLLTWALGAAVPVLVIVSAPAGLSEARRADLAGPLLLVGLAALAAGLVLTVVAARSITEPIDALWTAQRRVEDGALDVEVQVDDPGEVGLLQAGFNRMVAGLRERQRIRDLFGRHVGDEVARLALSQQAELGGETREAAVLFVDLVGSTTLAQQLPPQAVVAVLNEFFSVVVRAAASEGGWVNKFEGDAALCVFGPPTGEPDHADRALRAARLLHDELAVLQREHGLDAGVGVSTGTVVAGNVGAEDRYEYTVIGDPVNEAARLTDEAKSTPGRVLASGTAIEAAGAEAASWRPCGSALLRGRAEPTDLYAPA